MTIRKPQPPKIIDKQAVKAARDKYTKSGPAVKSIKIATKPSDNRKRS